MQIIEGFVCDATYYDRFNQRVLFGPGVGTTNSYYQSLEINDLRVFDDIDQARRVEPFLRARTALRYFNIGPAHLRLDIAETEEETYGFAEKTGLVVLKYGEQIGKIRVTQLIGTRAHLPEEHPTGLAYIPGAELRYNGMMPFPDFERALSCMAEVVRQGASPSRMALFEFERIAEYYNLSFDF